MAENIDIKSAQNKPTLTTPSDMGKTIDKKFGSEFNKVGLNMKSMHEEDGKKSDYSLKKKIFNLAKAETMIMQDEYLSGIYNKMSQDDAKSKWGYHWNEVIVNLIFNEYILDNQAYLQKYKNTTAYEKKRRGEEGAQELEKNVQDKIDTNKADGESPDFGRSEKISDVAKDISKGDKAINKADSDNDGHVNGSFDSNNKVDELFGFGKPTPLTTHRPSENDMFIIDKNNKTAVGVISPNLTQQQNIETGNKFKDTSRYERMAWYAAIQNGYKNVPPMPEDIKAKISGNKYTTSAYSNMPSYGAVREDGSWEAQQDLSKLQNDANNIRFSPDVIKAAEELVRISGRTLDGLKGSLENGVTFKGVLDVYKITDSDKADAIINKAVEIINKHTNNVEETTGAVSNEIPQQKSQHSIEADKNLKGSYDNFINNLKNKNPNLKHKEFNPMKEDNDLGDEYFPITTPLGSADDKLFVGVVNQGIDSHLEGFTKSKFTTKDNRRVFNFHKSDLPVLLRRLREIGSEEADMWADDIENYKPDIGETSGAAGAGSFAPALDINETTTTAGPGGGSSGTGQYSGPAIWAKNPANSRFAHAPAWKGGEILQEALKKGNYLTDPDSFKTYVRLVESINSIQELMNECGCNELDEAESVKQHAQEVLRKIRDNKMNNPELANMPDIKTLEDAWNQAAQTGSYDSIINLRNQEQPQMAEEESQDGLFKGKWNNNLNEESPALSIEGLVDWAGKNILRATTNPSQLIQDFAQQNNITVQQLRDKAKMYATNAGLGLIPNAGEVKDVLLDLVSQIDEMLGIVPKQNTLKQPPSTDMTTTNEMAPEIDNQTHFGDLKTKGLRKKIRVSELLALAQTQPEFSQIEEFANSKGIEVDKLIELADQYLRNNLGYDDMIETPEQRALVDLIDAATPQEQEVEPVVPSNNTDELPVQDIAEGNENDPSLLLQLGKVMFGSVNPTAREEDLIEIARNAMDKFFKGKTIQQAIQLMNDKLKPMGLANEGMMDDQPDSMVNVSDTSMANASDSPELNTSGAGTDSSTSIDDIKINEGKPYAGKEFKQKTFKAKDKQEVKKEIKRELDNKSNMNEDKKTPSMLNLEKIKRENATIANKEMASADALKQAKTYPDSENFYIEQDDKKVQEFQTAEEIEKAALAKIQPKDEGLHNDGNSANEGGNSITKRNLSKEEMTKLAMERGDGMHNIVYDNEPSKKFEDRLKRDMGDDQYKLRQDKMKEKQNMPMYNKDTQPTEGGDAAKQYDKFKNGFNESYMGKYIDDFGKSQFIEFEISNVKEVESINEGFKLNLDGLGNKYTQKVNENKDFKNVTNDFEYYVLEDLKTVVKIKNDTVANQSLNEAVDKMARLIGYNTNDFVNTKKSVKF